MFSDRAQAIIDSAKDYAFSAGEGDLSLLAVLRAIGGRSEASVLLAECLGISPEQLRVVCPQGPPPAACIGKLPLAEGTRSVLSAAKEMAEEIPDRHHPGLIDLRHLVCGLAMSRDACAILKASPISREKALASLASWYDRDIQSPKLEDLTDRLRQLRADLLTKVFGQDHAVHAFVEGVFNAEVVAAADTRRTMPRAVFVFAGPPGVGKTFLAELGAAAMGRPFRRFDMSAYSGHYQNEQLVGMAKSYHGAHPGTLTEFVEKNPGAVLLFDEIEKAHVNTIHLFLQILDVGALEDKYHERSVCFRDTTIIFTTNVGKRLYDRPNESGVSRANAAFHRRTILDALQNEKNPQTGEPFFPPAICSRMATGYPILFNHLRINELERVAGVELRRIADLFGRQYYKQVVFCDKLPMCLVLREGARADARMLRSQTEAFVKTEIFKFCQLFNVDRLEDVLCKVDRINFAMEDESTPTATEVQILFEQETRPRVLLVADADLAALYKDFIPEVDWRTAYTAERALQVLADQEVDMVLLDLWLGGQSETPSMTIQHFDHIPAAARGLDRGQELLRKVHDRLPGMPVYLLSLTNSEKHDNSRGSVDEELLMASIRGGGARGMIVSRFIDGMVKGWEEHRDEFVSGLIDICRHLYRERVAERMGQERRVLVFNTAPRVNLDNREISIRLRNLGVNRAIAAADAGEILDDVERPRTRFDEVIGAETAKEELTFFIDYLKNPRRFAALGLRPPKGVLLHGPPGTGQTMLARAMAGESEIGRAHV